MSSIITLFFWYVGDKKSIYLVLFVLVNYNSHAQVSYYEHSGCSDYEHIYAHVGSTNVLILGAFVAVSKGGLLHTMICLCKI